MLKTPEGISESEWNKLCTQWTALVAGSERQVTEALLILQESGTQLKEPKDLSPSSLESFKTQLQGCITQTIQEGLAEAFNGSLGGGTNEFGDVLPPSEQKKWKPK